MKKAIASSEAQSQPPKVREHHDYHPAFRILPPGRPLAECEPIKHPRGKDGAWGQ